MVATMWAIASNMAIIHLFLPPTWDISPHCRSIPIGGQLSGHRGQLRCNNAAKRALPFAPQTTHSSTSRSYGQCRDCRVSCSILSSRAHAHLFMPPQPRQQPPPIGLQNHRGATIQRGIRVGKDVQLVTLARNHPSQLYKFEK